MDIVEESFSRIFSGRSSNLSSVIKYSGKFKSYNAIVRKSGNTLLFSLSKEWKGVSDEIVIGLIQHLLLKILREGKGKKINTLNMQLYDDFIKNISNINSETAGSGTVEDEKLMASFTRVNNKYFLGLIDLPDIKWGSDSFRKLASYDYHINKIVVSSLFTTAPDHMIDYLIYHEMLHKKLKFSSTNGRSIHHNKEFKELEAKFENSKEIEQELEHFIRNWKRNNPKTIKNQSLSSVIKGIFLSKRQ
jgi:predicted metal-dependent hydrolase